VLFGAQQSGQPDQAALETLQLEDPTPGPWTVTFTDPKGVAAQQVGLSVIWQGQVTLEPTDQQVGDPGHQYTLAVQPVVRSARVQPSELGGFTGQFMVTWPGGQSVTKAARLDTTNGSPTYGDFTATVTVPQGVNGRANVIFTGAAPGVQGEASTAFLVRPGGGIGVTLDALRRRAVKDNLRWRQRLGYDFTWLLTTEEQRVSILQRLLIAMRNDQVDVLKGISNEQPTEIAIRASAIPRSSAARLELPLRPWSGTSPWADLLHAYEESVFAGDELNRQKLYAAIMEVLPLLDEATGRPAGPSDVYKAFLRVHQDEVAALEALLNSGKLDPDHRLRVEGLLGFWSQTVPAALTKRIEGFDDLANTLEALG
jgi:hypothetical protein